MVILNHHLTIKHVRGSPIKNGSQPDPTVVSAASVANIPKTIYALDKVKYALEGIMKDFEPIAGKPLNESVKEHIKDKSRLLSVYDIQQIEHIRGNPFDVGRVSPEVSLPKKFGKPPKLLQKADKEPNNLESKNAPEFCGKY